jgi:hypothetical protein
MEFSGEEYVLSREALEEMEQDEAEEEEEEEETMEDDVEHPDDDFSENDRNPLSPRYGDAGEGDEEGFEEEGVAAVERILLQSHPDFLRRIRQVLEQGVRRRATAYNDDDGAENSRRRSYRRRRIQDLPPPPYKAGKRLLTSGEFGEVDDSRCRKRMYEGPKTVTQFARFRELGWKRESTLAITKKWLPQETEGKVVAQYDRHVYSGQFSHDGTFFYTAAQDFKCRVYQTLDPASPDDWKLCKVLLHFGGRVGGANL